MGMQSPPITSAYPLHRAVAYWDLAGVKAAVEQGKANVNQAVMHKQGSADKSFGHTPLAVAMQSSTCCGFDRRYYGDEITDIIYYLLCSGVSNVILGEVYIKAAHRCVALLECELTRNRNPQTRCMRVSCAGANPNTAMNGNGASPLLAGM